MERQTATMARIYAQQGYLRKAAQIYRALLDKDPLCADWRKALAAIELQINQQPAPSRQELSLMMRDWIGLMASLKKSRQK